MKKVKLTEDQYFKDLTTILCHYSVYLTEKKGVELKFKDILEFKKWILEKHKQNENGKESI